MRAARTILTVFLTALMVVGTAVPALAAIANSKHDFARVGVDVTLKTATLGGSDEVCKACHIPHNTLQSVANYGSVNLKDVLWAKDYGTPASIEVNGPNGATTYASLPTTVMCMQCHDGTIAAATPYTLPGAANLGTSLTNDHPVDVPWPTSGPYYTDYEDATVVKDVKQLPLYEGDNKISCGSCHEPHGKAGTTKFLRVSNSGSALCKTCHKK